MSTLLAYQRDLLIELLEQVLSSDGGPTYVECTFLEGEVDELQAIKEQLEDDKQREAK